jgi:hypothetical protein
VRHCSSVLQCETPPQCGWCTGVGVNVGGLGIDGVRHDAGRRVRRDVAPASNTQVCVQQHHICGCRTATSYLWLAWALLPWGSCSSRQPKSCLTRATGPYVRAGYRFGGGGLLSDVLTIPPHLRRSFLITKIKAFCTSLYNISSPNGFNYTVIVISKTIDSIYNISFVLEHRRAAHLSIRRNGPDYKTSVHIGPE